MLSEALTQIILTIALYSLYLVLIDVGRRKITKAPPLMLNVLPCCCWPCLPFPILQMTETNLSWLRIFVLQLPIVQVELLPFLSFDFFQKRFFTAHSSYVFQTSSHFGPVSNLVESPKTQQDELYIHIVFFPRSLCQVEILSC